ncbi:hypothetical protein DRQ50_06295 [bacterium]|nr:MAG: hypothetical protein DRQ50_06295 [bacterium]
MRLLRLTLLYLVTALLCGVTVQAGELAPGLADLLADRDPADEVRVLVVLQEQVDAPALARSLRMAKATGGDVHREVVSALQRTAAAGQAELLDELALDKAATGIRSWRSHWLINALVVTGTVTAIENLADHPLVARIEPDLVATSFVPLTGRTVPGKVATIGTGVAAVGAPRVWRELGIDGTGVVVGILDTGVDGAHPALAQRWRGNFAPASECWLDAAELGDTDFPVDRRFHGTHVMGTMTGQAPGDSIGVAPGALWIGSNALNNPGDNDAFDNAILVSLEFMTDPDGDPATSDDVPAVVHNSWGIHAGFEGYFDCDSRWWDAMDACEAAGVVLTWSVGNEGPSVESIRSPADRADTPTNAFSVGSTATAWPFAVSDFSSRGPSLCGGEFAIKPEIAAPGEDIRSAAPGGGYQVLSGTSMAGPHVAGIVALMRQANPQADVATIKQVLMDTARDLGTPGEDNDTGWGLVDAFAAVSAIMDGVGTVNGRITGTEDGLSLAGAHVQLTGELAWTFTDAEGYFGITLPAGPAELTVTSFGHADGTLAVTVPDLGTITADLALVPLPLTIISGTVRSEEGQRLGDATVTILETPLEPVATLADGTYALEVPVEPGRTWTLRADAPGHGSQDRTVTAPAPVVVDFSLPVLAMEGFESGDFSAYPWRHAGDQWWTTNEVEVWRGSFSARAGIVGDAADSRLELDVAPAVDDSVIFRLHVSSEAGYDQLRFLVDGSVRASWSGEVDWMRHAQPLAAGSHTLAWVFTRDAAGSGGSDAAWLDDIELPLTGIAPAPVALVTPAAVIAAVTPGGQTAAHVTVANEGHADLNWSVVGLATKGRVTSVPSAHLVLDKGQADPRQGPLASKAGGGTDPEGRIWLDSNQAGGPVFVWEDISATGVDLGAGDDELLGPFSLGFDFPWAGAGRDSVYISSNGFLAFSATDPTHANQGIPDPAVPNGILALFWDDLDPGLGGRILVAARTDRFIVQFQAVAHYGAPGTTETCQAVLHADGTIDYRYQTVGNGGDCTVGIENDTGDGGLQVVFNREGYLQDGLAVRFRTPRLPSWLTVNPAAGTVTAGGNQDMQLDLDAAGLALGSHHTWLHLITDDPATALLTVPVTLVIDGLADGEVPDVTGVVFGAAVPNPFNPSTRLEFELPRDLTVNLGIYDVSGRLVRSLARGLREQGRHRIEWDGTDRSGRPVASGVYFARLVAGSYRQTRSLVLIR